MPRTLFYPLFIVLFSTFFSVASTQCFADRLQRCQQEVSQVMSSVPGDFPAPSSTSDGFTNPSYRHIYNDLPNKCSTIRSDLDCLLTYTIGCVNQVNIPTSYDPHVTTSSNPNTIYQAKAFLDKYCDHNGGWRSTQCFNKAELRNCESSLTTLTSGSPCHNFNTFRSCAINYIRNNCLSHETVFISSYLIDKASDQSWQCSPGEYYLTAFGRELNIDRLSGMNPSIYGSMGARPDQHYHGDGHTHQPGQHFVGDGHGHRTQTHYPGDGHEHSSLPGAPYAGPPVVGSTGVIPYGGSNFYDRTNPYSGSLGIGGTPGSMGIPGSSIYGPSLASGSYGTSSGPFGDAHSAIPHGHTIQGDPVPVNRDPINPLVGGPSMMQPPYGMGMGPGQGFGDRQYNLFPAENCVEKSVYFARSCEDMLLQRQREARNARTGIDVQRRLCCSLFFYHDCLSKTVIQYCRDASPTTVDIMMGQRKREMVITCRDFSREQCNSSTHLSLAWMTIVLSLAGIIGSGSSRHV